MSCIQKWGPLIWNNQNKLYNENALMNMHIDISAM